MEAKMTPICVIFALQHFSVVIGKGGAHIYIIFIYILVESVIQSNPSCFPSLFFPLKCGI